MSFKEQAIADLPSFLDVGEFGDTVEIDGVTMACVLDDDEAPNSGDGLSVLEATLYVRAEDFVDPPVERQRLTVGGREWNITRVDEEQGMLLLRLQWFNS